MVNDPKMTQTLLMDDQLQLGPHIQSRNFKIPWDRRPNRCWSLGYCKASMQAASSVAAVSKLPQERDHAKSKPEPDLPFDLMKARTKL